jgi:hypothetical protein
MVAADPQEPLVNAKGNVKETGNQAVTQVRKQ